MASWKQCRGWMLCRQRAHTQAPGTRSSQGAGPHAARKKRKKRRLSPLRSCSVLAKRPGTEKGAQEEHQGGCKDERVAIREQRWEQSRGTGGI